MKELSDCMIKSLYTIQIKIKIYIEINEFLKNFLRVQSKNIKHSIILTQLHFLVQYNYKNVIECTSLELTVNISFFLLHVKLIRNAIVF